MQINWSDIHPQTVLGRIVRMPARLLPGAKILHIRRGPARGLKWIAASAINGCWLGTYELEKQTALLRFVKAGMVVYDIGAQAGFYTLFFSRLVGENGHILAFEPCVYSARFLLDHVRMNCLTNVVVLQVAVSDRGGLTGMTIHRGIMENSLESSCHSILNVGAVTIDGCGLPAPDLIKLDAEGAESQILKGAEKTLSMARPIVFVALHGTTQGRVCATLLRQAGYRIYDLHGVPLVESIATDEIYALPDSAHQE